MKKELESILLRQLQSSKEQLHDTFSAFNREISVPLFSMRKYVANAAVFESFVIFD